MALRSGDNFAGYRVVRRLGSGGMGQVYLAEHPRLPRRDALKILPSGISADQEFRQRFGREADLASTLWHPNIVGVHDRGEFSGQLWIAMDYVDGLDASRLLAKSYPSGMPVDMVVNIVMAVASALDYAHDHGLVHRDVKPANIMLTNPGGINQRVLLTDFGIARSVDDISGLTATNMTVGTVAYSAPGQLMGKAIDGRADQYALAATAYHLLTGTYLFAHSNPAVVISHHLTAPPPNLADSRPGVAGLDPVLAVALAKDPGDRFPSCAEFALALTEQVSTERAVSPVAVTRPATASPPKNRITRKAAVVSSQPSAALKPAGQAAEPIPSWQKIIVGVYAVMLLVVVLSVAGILLVIRPWQEGGTEARTMTSAPVTYSSTRSSSMPSPPVRPAPPVTETTGVELPSTKVISVVAVDARGQTTNGYREAPAGPATKLTACDNPSPAAVSSNIYSCYPSAAGADVCWPSPPMSMICVDNPWDKEVRRLQYDTNFLSAVQPSATPRPFALTLDNGTHCRSLVGGARRGRSDGYIPFYGCGANSTAWVLGDLASGGDPIDRSKPLWTLIFEQAGFQSEVRSVTTAWFAGS